MTKSKITPVIYLGAARNGTTWLGNILNEIFEIPTAFHPLHYGINESAIHKNYKYWGDLTDNDNYIKFLEIYSSSDFFLLVDGKKKYFYENPQDNFFEFFLTLMDQFADTKETEFWCTKLDPDFYENESDLKLFLKTLNDRYQDVKFIAIQRSFSEYITSFVYMSGRFHSLRNKLRFFSYILGSARYHLYYNSITTLINNKGGILLEYENLTKNYTDQINKISEYININPKRKELVASIRNSSFKKNKTKIKSKSAELIHSVLSISMLANKLILKLYSKLINKNPQLYYRILKYKFFKEDLIKDLEKTNDFKIIDLVKNDELLSKYN